MHTSTSFRSTAFALTASVFIATFGLSACGRMGAPSRSDIKQVVQSAMQQQNANVSSSTFGFISGPYDPANLSIDNADCTAKDNGVYACAVTATTKNGTHTANLNLKKINNVWQIMEN